MKTKITKCGKDYVVPLPRQLLKLANLSEGDVVDVKIKNNNISIEKAKPKSIGEHFRNFDEKYQPVQIDWGNSVGEEVW